MGELGRELHHPLAYQLHLWDRIWEAGQEFGIHALGIRAMDSLRIEKSYRYWTSDLSTECSPFESGFSRFVHLNKGEFVGREALVKQQRKGPPTHFVTLEVAVKDADPWGNEPIHDGKTVVGRATSGAYGYTLGKSFAVGQELRRGLCEAEPCQARHQARDGDPVRALSCDRGGGIALGPEQRAAQGVRRATLAGRHGSNGEDRMAGAGGGVAPGPFRVPTMALSPRPS